MCSKPLHVFRTIRAFHRYADLDRRHEQGASHLCLRISLPQIRDSLAHRFNVRRCRQGAQLMRPVGAKTIPEVSLDWSADRPRWQRDALQRIVTSGMPDDGAVTLTSRPLQKGT
jgi:hypothetical protein